jgi:hypothetical protein
MEEKKNGKPGRREGWVGDFNKLEKSPRIEQEER